jgi:hypothetical protein
LRGHAVVIAEGFVRGGVVTDFSPVVNGAAFSSMHQS